MDLDRIGQALLQQALAYPDVWEDYPWGERVLKVRKKIFAFLVFAPDTLSLTVKLPASAPFAGMFEECVPTGYGLGKHGWISCRLTPDAAFDADLLGGWLEESYRAVAPKRLARLLTAPAPD